MHFGYQLGGFISYDGGTASFVGYPTTSRAEAAMTDCGTFLTGESSWWLMLVIPWGFCHQTYVDI